MGCADKEEKMPERRKFLFDMVRGLGAATVGGLHWTGILDGKKVYATDSAASRRSA